MSNILLASLIACWLERLQHGHFGQARAKIVPKAYVDDISATVIAEDLRHLRAGLRSTHETVQTFSALSGSKLNPGKCFTYRDSHVANLLPDIPNHKEAFRLVGGSIVCGTASSWTSLVQQRVDGWLASVGACSLLPRARLLAQQQLMNRLTWGQGTHDLYIPQSRITTMRATMTRALLRISYYSLTPMVLYTLVVMPTLEPLFAMNFAALRSLQRFCSKAPQRQYINANLHSVPGQQKGPLRRAQQLFSDPVYRPALQQILQFSKKDRSWEHDLRERWREHHLRQIPHSRQDFQGIERADRIKATALLHDLHTQSDGLQLLLDRGIPGPHFEKDPRPRSKLLVYILTGGLMCPSRDGRHRQQQSVLCPVCKVPNEVLHIHWNCKRYNAQRAPIQHLRQRMSRSPQCFRYAAIPTTSMSFTLKEIKQIHGVLIDIWQKHIREWHDTDINDQYPPDDQVSPPTDDNQGNGLPSGSQTGMPPSQPSSSSAPANPLSIDREQRGHRIRYHGGGVFCVKCGKCTSRLEHLNPRILKKKCPFPNLEPSAWMDTPGKINATARLDKLERDMNDKYNTPKHSLVWNRKLGKEPKQEDSYGKLWCRLCGRTFAWRYRHNNLPKTVCRPLDDKPCPPEWVTAMTAADVNQDMPMHGLSVSTKFARARQGIG